MDTVRSAVLAALYLRGLPSGAAAPPVRQWPNVLAVLRRAGVQGAPPECPSELADRLREAGFWQEASRLMDILRWRQALLLLERGQVLSVEDSGYPEPWRARGGVSPPVLWRQPGRVALAECPSFIAVVGSRRISRPVRAFAERAGERLVASGRTLISGGAVGCDRAAARGAASEGGAVVELLPCGFDRSVPSSAERWSLVAPGEGFSTALAMERNLLLYAASERSLVVHARFREGGSWQGAVAALRAKVGPIFVREPGLGEEVSDPDFVAAHRALLGLGAQALCHPDLLSDAPIRDPMQPALAWGA